LAQAEQAVLIVSLRAAVYRHRGRLWWLL